MMIGSAISYFTAITERNEEQINGFLSRSHVLIKIFVNLGLMSWQRSLREE